MIKLTLPLIPQQLKLNESDLTQRYKTTGEAVWKQDYITDALMKMSGGKCAYSELPLNTHSNYMEVEHFRHKDKYPEDVVKWGNLLPSCKKCNTTKGKWDVVAEPIVNPLTDNPADHLSIRSCRYYAKTDKGSNTIKVVALNDRNHFVIRRYETAVTISDLLECKIERFQDIRQPARKNCIAQEIKSHLEECTKLSSPFSAAIATFLLYEWGNYAVMKQLLVSSRLWDDDFRNIEAALQRIALP